MPDETDEEIRARLEALPGNALTLPCPQCNGTGIQKAVADPNPPACRGCCRGRVLRPFEDIPEITFGPVLKTEAERRAWYDQTAAAMQRYREL